MSDVSPNLPPSREPLVDRAGHITRSWWRALHTAFGMVSQNTSDTTDVETLANTMLGSLESRVADLEDQAMLQPIVPTGTLAWQNADRVTIEGLAMTGQASAAGAATGNLSNAPIAGPPGFWLRVTINGAAYAIPCWAIP